MFMRSQSISYWMETEEVESVAEAIIRLNEEDERAEYERFCYEENEDLKQWLRTHTPEDENYSDIFKDVYGFRPRF